MSTTTLIIAVNALVFGEAASHGLDNPTAAIASACSYFAMERRAAGGEGINPDETEAYEVFAEFLAERPEAATLPTGDLLKAAAAWADDLGY